MRRRVGLSLLALANEHSLAIFFIFPCLCPPSLVTKETKDFSFINENNGPLSLLTIAYLALLWGETVNPPNSSMVISPSLLSR